MGHKPTDSRLAMLVIALLLNPMIALGDDPCREMTVAGCELTEDNIIGKHNFDAAICESLCKTSDHCQFWRVFQDDSMELPECLHLRTNYHQDCVSFAGPVDGDINSCLDTDLSTCSAYIEEECQYVGERLVDLEPPSTDVSNIADCQEWGQKIQDFGANYFYFSGVT